MMLESLSADNRGAVLEFLRRRPHENVFLDAIAQTRRAEGLRDAFLVARGSSNEVTGAVYFVGELVLAAADDATLRAFAAETRRHEAVSSFHGEKTTVESFWRCVGDWHVPPALVCASQPLYVLWPDNLRNCSSADVRPAREDELLLVAGQSREMHRSAVGHDPSTRQTFLPRIRNEIKSEAWWVWICDGELRFQCKVGPKTQETAQLQEVWTPPALRRKGYASRALGAIARKLLEREKSLSLFVDDWNTGAMSVYEQMGFSRTAELATYFFY